MSRVDIIKLLPRYLRETLPQRQRPCPYCDQGIPFSESVLPLSHKYMINSRASGRQWLRCHWTNPIKRRAKR